MIVGEDAIAIGEGGVYRPVSFERANAKVDRAG
jgi:hypothetical protein